MRGIEIVLTVIIIILTGAAVPDTARADGAPVEEGADDATPHEIVVTAGLPYTKLQYGYEVVDWLTVGAVYRGFTMFYLLGAAMGPRVDLAWSFFDEALTVGAVVEGSAIVSYDADEPLLGLGVLPTIYLRYHQKDSMVTSSLEASALFSSWDDYDPDEYDNVETIQLPMVTFGMDFALTDRFAILARVGTMRTAISASEGTCQPSPEDESASSCKDHLGYEQMLAVELGVTWHF